MSVNRLFAIPVVALAAATVVLAPAAARDRKPPRIVAAAMVDANGNFRADRVRLTYSERVRHVADRDGRYPFAVVGYRIRSIRAASGQTLLVFVAEKAQPDPNARPPIRYRRTRSKPVRDGVGNQAVAQLFRLVRAHRHAPPAAPVSAPAPAPAPPAAAADADRDGAPDGRDCAPKDASIRPGAPDLPDLSFVDTNCDGIDGTEADAVFVSKNGNDNNPGTKAKPKATIGAAVATIAAGNGKYVLAAAGEYGHLGLGKDASGVGVYGGYDPDNWSRRSASLKTSIVGAPEGVLADNATRVVLQNLSVQGNTDTYHWSSYGILAVNGSALTLERVTVIVSPATDVTAAIHGTEGFPGRDGGKGENGHYGTCDDLVYDGEGGKGGMGGSGAANAGFNGGVGGFPGYYEGQPGHGPGGGGGGKNGDPGQSGGSGADGLNGTPGGGGSGGVGVNLAPLPSTFGKGAGGVDGGAGRDGTAGRGGSGGGGGGGHVGLIEDELGNGGGGGGGGGAGGSGGGGGPGGAGSFGIYLYGSILVVESSSITAGNGAAGTSGGNGGRGGYGGARGYGGSFCLSNLGRGGRGGLGGYGGPGAGGGGGAGGPSIGIFKGGTSKATVTHSTIKIGKAGAGGVGGRGGGGFLGGPNGGVGANGEPGIAADIYPKS